MKIPIFIFISLSFLGSCLIRREPPQYNETLSRQYVRYAGVAFCSPQCVQSWTCQTTSSVPPLVDVEYITSPLTKAVVYIGYDQKNRQIITSWRGSANAKNWIEDFNFQLEPYKCRNCQIHVGFHFDYLSLKKRLVQRANSIISKYQVRKIICTGHSLGAALSTINGIEFMLSYGRNIEVNVHNFGSPRIGNVDLAKYLDEKLPVIQRVVHNRDAVPHLPPEAVGYWHAAYEIFFDAEMKEYKVCSQSGQDRTCSNKYSPDYNPDDHDFYFINISQVKC